MNEVLWLDEIWTDLDKRLVVIYESLSFFLEQLLFPCTL